MEQRKILFKAKRLDNGEWVEGSLVNNPIGPVIVWWEDSIENIVDVDPSTVCQFTGIYDKDGNPIFEGDYLVDGETTFDVEYVDCGFSASMKGLNNFVINLTALSKCSVVCGSKFDRKEGEV